MHKFEFQAIGTTWTIDFDAEISKEIEESVLKQIKNRIDIFDINYSRFRDDSLVTKMSREAGKFTLPEDADKMISLYKEIYVLTEGSVTPLIGETLVQAGYDAKYSLKQSPMTKPPSWDEVMVWENPTLTLKKPALLDFGAGGKGYLVDIVSEILEKNNILNYYVDAGGDMRQKNSNGSKLRVGLENPNDISQVIGVIEILNQSLCGSAGNRRKWADFHHIINPHTLSSPKEIGAVWVLGEDTLLSDILTTALFFVSPEELQQHYKFDYLIVFADFSINKSQGFNAELFT